MHSLNSFSPIPTETLTHWVSGRVWFGIIVIWNCMLVHNWLELISLLANFSQWLVDPSTSPFTPSLNEWIMQCPVSVTDTLTVIHSVTEVWTEQRNSQGWWPTLKRSAWLCQANRNKPVVSKGIHYFLEVFPFFLLVIRGRFRVLLAAWTTHGTNTKTFVRSTRDGIRWGATAVIQRYFFPKINKTFYIFYNHNQ